MTVLKVYVFKVNKERKYNEVRGEFVKLHRSLLKRVMRSLPDAIAQLADIFFVFGKRSIVASMGK